MRELERLRIHKVSGRDRRLEADECGTEQCALVLKSTWETEKPERMEEREAAPNMGYRFSWAIDRRMVTGNAYITTMRSRWHICWAEIDGAVSTAMSSLECDAHYGSWLWGVSDRKEVIMTLWHEQKERELASTIHETYTGCLSSKRTQICRYSIQHRSATTDGVPYNYTPLD